MQFDNQNPNQNLNHFNQNYSSPTQNFQTENSPKTEPVNEQNSEQANHENFTNNITEVAADNIVQNLSENISENENEEKFSDDDKSYKNLTPTEIQILKMQENLKKLKQKAIEEKKQIEEKNFSAVISLLKRKKLHKVPAEIWESKINEIQQILKI